MESVVHQSLGNVIDTDATSCGDRTHIKDALVRHRVVGCGVQDRVVIVQPVRDVIGTHHRRARGIAKPTIPHHPDVHPRDRQDASAPPRRTTDRSNAAVREPTT